jgi:prolipoprotein diacylglyceryltransferase
VLSLFFLHALAYAVNNAKQSSCSGVPAGRLIRPGILGVIAIIASGTQHGVVFDTEAGVDEGRRSMEYYLLWLAGLMVVGAVVGFVIAVAIFFALFLRVNARAPLRRNAILTALAVLFLAVMSYVFVLDFPRGYLQEAVEMPWPFR